MKLRNSEKFGFITLGVAAINAALMAHGVETVPGLWVKEVYQDPVMGATIGWMSGVAIGGVIATGYLEGKDAVKSGVKALRGGFFS